MPRGTSSRAARSRSRRRRSTTSGRPPASGSAPPTTPTNLTLSPESSPPEIWTDWTQSTDNVDPQSEIMYDVYLDGIFEEHAALGGGSTITYCRDTGPPVVTM